jgi:hypothetical protein
MAKRLILAVIVTLGLVCAASLALADDKSTSHQGIVVSVEGNRLTMTDLQGRNQHTHLVPDWAAITCEGTVCSLQQLKRGMHITVTMQQVGDRRVAGLIEATEAPPRR